MIKTCIFDMGNVLVHFSHRLMLDQMAEVCDCSAASLKEWLFSSGKLLEYEKGMISEETLLEYLEECLGKTIDRPRLIHAASDIFTVNEEIISLLDELKAREIKLILLSNTSRIHFEQIQSQCSILDNFEHYVLSYEVKLLKPDLEIYRVASRMAQTDPEDCFFTDDLLPNIIAAREAGLQAEQFRNTAQLEEHLLPLLIK